MADNTDIDALCYNTIRILAADQVQSANSGHPGAPMGMAPIAHLVWSKYMNINAEAPDWIGRDRFVLSNGHGCALLYTMLHLTGFKLFNTEELKKFRKLGSKTCGHPESIFEGIEVTTGPLGQGISNSVGLASAEAHLGATYNKPDFNLFDNYTYVFCGDGCLQEGVSSEASSLAGHLGLGKLIVFYDDNGITIDGKTSLSFTEDVAKRYEAYGWQVLEVKDANTDLKAIQDAIEKARATKDRPTMIKCTTTIGFGSSKEGTHGVHGSPLGPEDLANVKKKFGFNPEESFVVPEAVRKVYGDVQERGKQKYAAWQKLFNDYQQKYPTEGKQLARQLKGELPEGWEKALPVYKPSDKEQATRAYGGEVINALAKEVPELFGGSADLNPSTLTYLKCSDDFQKETYAGRNFRFGVREHGMAAICNGVAAYGCLRAFNSTFFTFIGYALGAVRLSAISEVPVIYVMTHDSIGVGEDGPTHQPIETLESVRALPNINVVRPCDGNETSGAWALAISSKNTPHVLVLSRQGCPNQEGTSAESVKKGAYILKKADKPKLVIVATGSEVQIAVAAAATLGDTQVISMPCQEIFDAQPLDYKLSCFPKGVPVLSIEASATHGWQRYAHGSLGMTSFGASGKGPDVYKHFGITPEGAVEKANKLIEFYKGRTPESLIERPW
eukprot:TRINITY_DN31062_c0_g1_i1.p1 TRINITY_DN31062_c0_g1~~TRINITY_DN31062_c0_g1_i1.p1  ORF type:complete len:688 (-),score=108.40 TRINITY_DN31062_c0_g1_i1:47-2062(-)